MAVYQITQRIADDPEAFGDAVGRLASHLVAWESPKPSAISISGGRMRVTVAFTIPADQLAHIGVTVITP